MHLLRHLALGALSTHALGANTCYFPNGVASTDEPCDPTALFTQCCGSRSACLTNGLCILEASNDTGINYARGTCTDRSWVSSLCPQQCTLNQDTPGNASAYDFRTNGVQVWQCGSQGFADEAKYCCESDAERQRCCSTQAAVFTLQGAVVGASTSASTTSSSSSLSSRSTSAPVSTPAPTPPPSRSSATASSATPPPTQPASPQPREPGPSAIGIGAGVGGAVVLVLLIALALFVVRRHQRAKRRGGAVERLGVSELHGTAKQPVEIWTLPAEVYTQPHELPSRGQPAWELSADPRTPRVGP